MAKRKKYVQSPEQRANANLRNQNRRHARIKAGLCRDCDGPRAGYTNFCIDHWLRDVSYKQAKKHAGQITKEECYLIIKAVWKREGGCCAIGRNPLIPGSKSPYEAPQLDHIIPYSEGGPFTLENIRYLSKAFNNAKSDSADITLSRWYVSTHLSAMRWSIANIQEDDAKRAAEKKLAG